MLSIVKFVAFLLVLAVVASFAVKNGQEVTLHYYFGLESVPLPLFLILFGSMVLGALISLLIAIGEQMRLRFTIRSMEKRMRRMEEELHSLRNLPLTSEFLEQEEAAGEGKNRRLFKGPPGDTPSGFKP